MRKTIVFGGWAVPPEILKNVFGDNADYIDINRVMPKLFESNQLKNDWPEIIISEYHLTSGCPPGTIAGWSTGAMFAYAAARLCHPQKLILLSATPCFCRKEGFRFGARPAVIDQMLCALEQDKDNVLRSFYERCGLEYGQHAAGNYTTAELSSGLSFLKQADLRPLTPLPTPPAFRHGNSDQIIPAAASKYFSGQIGGEHVEVEGGHAFFNRPGFPVSCASLNL